MAMTLKEMEEMYAVRNNKMVYGESKQMKS
jgi:hypothetical protein